MPRIRGLGLHAAGAHRRVESPPQDGVVPHRSRGVRSGCRCAPVLAAMTLRSRLIAAFLASTLLPLVATVWITTSLSTAACAMRQRASSTDSPARSRHGEAVLSARTRCVEAGRARGPARPRLRAANVAEWPESVGRSGRAARPSGSSVSGTSGERVDYMRRVESPGRPPGVEIYSRDLGGVSMEQLSTQVRKRAASSTRSTRATCGADSR